MKKILLIVMIIAALTLMVPAALALTWTIDTVDSSGSGVGQYSSLAIDPSGNTHISYWDGDNNDLKHAWQSVSGGTWNIETVDSAGDVGSDSSLAIDTYGTQHISYYDGTNGNLKHAWKSVSGGTWNIETAVSDNPKDYGVGSDSSLAIDSSGNPHISYYDQVYYDDGDLKYASKNGGTWTTETVDSDYDVGRYSSLAFDSSGNPHICYLDANQNLKHAWKSVSGGTWTTETVGPAGNVGDVVISLAFDSSGNPHISYFDLGDLRHAWKSGSSGPWNIETVDSITAWADGQHTSLAFDRSGNPHIAYYDDYLKHAWKSGSSGPWATETVDSGYHVGTWPSLAFDSSGNPHISYFYLYGALKHASTIQEPPVANNGGPYIIDIDDNLYLDGSASYDPNPGDSIVAYTWDLDNDGIFDDAIGVTPYITWEHLTEILQEPRVGIHTISLRVTDTWGLTGTAATTLTIYDPRPVASFTADPNPAAVGQEITFDASSSSAGRPDRTIVLFEWNFGDGTTSTGKVVTHTYGASGDYHASLTVTDDMGLEDNTIGIITIIESNLPPIANPGGPYTAGLGTTVTLDGSGSNDPDGNIPLTYSWEFVSMPAGSTATLSNPDSANPSFVVDKPGDYTISLVVTDALDLSSEPVQVLVSTVNTPPVADAGPDQSVNVLGSVVYLDGTLSFDPDTDPFTYAWTISSKPAGSSAALSDPISPQPAFVADVQGEYVITLAVTDLFGASSDPDSITVTFINVKPVADAGVNQAVPAGTTVTLDASGSHDANGDPLTYLWGITSKPPGSTATLSDPAVQKPAFTVDKPGDYTVKLIVNDGYADSDPATVTVHARVLTASVNIDPDTLNMKSRSGKNAVTVYIEIAGADVNAIDVGSVTLTYAGRSITAQASPTSVGDENRNGIPDRMVKFNRQELIGIVVPGESITLVVNGKVAGDAFEGTDTIRVISEDKKDKSGDDRKNNNGDDRKNNNGDDRKNNNGDDKKK